MSSVSKVAKELQSWQQQRLKVVLVTGVFDLLHVEHLRFLVKAKQAGDKLVVGVETDARVRQIKGPDRPLHSQSIRLEQLRFLASVDLVFLLPEAFATEAAWRGLLQALKPDIYAVSSHTSHLNNKQRLCAEAGVDFRIVHPHNPAFSTTLLLEKILAS